MQGDDLGTQLERATRWMQRIGKRLQINWLIYNPVEFYRWHVYAVSTRDAFADAIPTFPEAHSFADVGAGTGTYASALRRRGKSVAACEKAIFGRIFSYAQRVPSRSFDLTRPEPARLPTADVAYCLEVAEHVPPDLGDRLVAFLAQFPAVLFSAAHPGQGGTAHINEQPKNYWLERFSERDMHLNSERSSLAVEALRAAEGPWWLIDNLMVLTRGPSVLGGDGFGVSVSFKEPPPSA